MSLRSKIATVLFLAVALFLAADQGLHHRSFGGRFQELERSHAREKLGRVEDAFDRELRSLELAGADLASLLGDSADWTEPDSLELLDVTVRAMSLHFVLAFQPDGWVHLLRVTDPASGEPLRLRQLPTERLSSNHPLLRDDDKLPRGPWVTERGVLLIGSTELAGEDGAPTRLSVGRFLDERMLASLRANSMLAVDVIVASGFALPEHQHDKLSQAWSGGAPLIEEVDGETLRVWSAVPDVEYNPAILLRADVERVLTPLWKDLNHFGWLTTIATVVLFPLVILLLLQWIVTGPLSRLTSHIVAIGASDDTDARLELHRSDEIGQLADEFDRMLRKLAESRANVVETARLAGMSEVSAGVMHNIGNVLNSVNVATDTARGRVSALELADMRAVQAELEKHVGSLDEYLASDDRGKHLLPFLDALLERFESSVGGALGELDVLGNGVDHISNLLDTLRGYDSRVDIVERVDLADQVNAAVELCLRSFELGHEVCVERVYDDLPRALIERHKLMEILVNVIRNAVQSMLEADREPRLTVRLIAVGDAAVRVVIADNGSGISRGDLTSIFNLGTTTRDDGRGVGLHLSATAAAEMGGNLTAHSDGPGHGATFTLHLPVQTARDPHARATSG